MASTQYSVVMTLVLHVHISFYTPFIALNGSMLTHLRARDRQLYNVATKPSMSGTPV